MKTSILLAMLCVFAFSCTHEAIVQPINADSTGIVVVNPIPTVKSDTVCFNSEVLPLFTTYCSSAGCHNTISRPKDVVLTSYNSIMSGIRAGLPNSSKYYKEIGNGMPPPNSPQLTTVQLELIKKWINQGAKNTNCINSCDTTKFTYSSPIQTLITNNCSGCHGIKPGSGNVYLGDYASAKAFITANKDRFLNAINHSASLVPSKRMPPSNKMVDCQIVQFTKWINNGYPQ